MPQAHGRGGDEGPEDPWQGLRGQCAPEIVARALALDGTCTGEHGIGLHKMDFLLQETGSGAVAMMRAIKHALDPDNIMNPGKIFLD